MAEVSRKSISVLVDNEAGVLSQVSRMFSRKGYNIESLAVGTTNDPAISRMTIEVTTDDNGAKLLCSQLSKLIFVHNVQMLEGKNCIRRELVMIKVKTEDAAACDRVMQIANIFRASIIDVSPNTLTLAIIGKETKDDAIVSLLEPFGVLELVRTGTVAMERGINTIYEATKERGEFDYGKNVL